MSVTVNLTSDNEGILKDFLNSFYEKNSKVDDDVVEWINVFNQPLEAIDVMTAVIDNSDKYNIGLWVSMDAGLLVEVNQKNIEDVIKFMLFRFYKE